LSARAASQFAARADNDEPPLTGGPEIRVARRDRLE